jgi:hypothetical protein
MQPPSKQLPHEHFNLLILFSSNFNNFVTSAKYTMLRLPTVDTDALKHVGVLTVQGYS